MRRWSAIACSRSTTARTRSTERAGRLGSSTPDRLGVAFAANIEKPLGRRAAAESAGVIERAARYPPQFKIGSMSNNPPIDDIGPEAKMGMKAGSRSRGFGRRRLSPQGSARTHHEGVPGWSLGLVLLNEVADAHRPWNARLDGFAVGRRARRQSRRRSRSPSRRRSPRLTASTRVSARSSLTTAYRARTPRRGPTTRSICSAASRPS